MSENIVILLQLLTEAPYYDEFIKTLPTEEVASFHNVLQKHVEKCREFAMSKLDPIKAVEELYPDDKEFVQDYKDILAGVGDREAISKRIVEKIYQEPRYKQEFLIAILSNRS